MEGIVWIIALIGGVYVFGMSTSPSGEIEKISDEILTSYINTGLLYFSRHSLPFNICRLNLNKPYRMLQDFIFLLYNKKQYF